MTLSTIQETISYSIVLEYPFLTDHITLLLDASPLHIEIIRKKSDTEEDDDDRHDDHEFDQCEARMSGE